MRLLHISLALILGLTSWPALPHQSQSESRTPRLFLSFNRADCEELPLHLGEFAEALRSEPGAQAHIIGYLGRTDPPGKMVRTLGYAQGELAGYLGKETQSVTVEAGGIRDQFTLELWIVPQGVAAPRPTGAITASKSAERSAYLFDTSEATIMEYEDESYLSFGLACEVSYPDWGEFSGRLRQEPGLRGHLIIYVGHDDRPAHAKRIEKLLRDILTADYPNETKQLRMGYGGKREWAQIEIWVVPENRPDPKPTPGAQGSNLPGISQ